jgi:hypothetical protein
MIELAIAHIDLELVPLITRDALAGLDRMLSTMPPSDNLPASEVGALVRLLSTVAGAKPSGGANGQPD